MYRLLLIVLLSIQIAACGEKNNKRPKISDERLIAKVSGFEPVWYCIGWMSKDSKTALVTTLLKDKDSTQHWLFIDKKSVGRSRRGVSISSFGIFWKQVGFAEDTATGDYRFSHQNDIVAEYTQSSTMLTLHKVNKQMSDETIDCTKRLVQKVP